MKSTLIHCRNNIYAICIILCILSPFSFYGGIRHTVALASSAPFSNSNNHKYNKINEKISRTVAGQSTNFAPSSSNTILAAQKTGNEDSRSKNRFALWKNSTFRSLNSFASFKTSTDPNQQSSKIYQWIQQQRQKRIRQTALHSTATHDNDLAGDVVQGEDSWWKYGEHQTPLFSRLTYKYTTPLFEKAQNRNLEPTDAFLLPEHIKMKSVVKNLDTVYQGKKQDAEQKERITGVKKSNSLTLAKSLLLHQRKKLLFTATLRLTNTLIQAFPAILVARLLRTIENSAPPATSIVAASALIAVLSLKMIVENLYFHSAVKLSTSVRGSVSGLLFDKSLRLPGGGGGAVVAGRSRSWKKKKKGETLGVGGVLNLMQSDASTLESVALQIHTIWDGPLQIMIYTSLLFKYLGPCVFWGIGVLLFTVPINSITLRVLNKLSRKEYEAKDARTKRTAEALSHMKLLKLQAWEDFFAKDITQHRELELKRHTIRGIVRALNNSFSNAVPAIILVVTLMAYSRSGRPMKASTIFTAISLFNQLRFPLLFYPMLIDALANGKNSLKRVSDFLNSEEIIKYVTKVDSIGGSGGSIQLENGNFLWSGNGGLNALADESQKKEPQVPALCDANIIVSPGEVVAVVGSVGSGKSALIKALLGELSPVPRNVVDPSKTSINGAIDHATGITDIPKVTWTGPVSYCAQESWLAKGSIREAIVFGREYDEKRYKEAIRDAGLDRDIIDTKSYETKESRGMLTHDTDVGEGGSSLSGGQRARVALARALYAQDKEKGGGVYLLDDPLAALDASVGSIVFERLMARFRRENAAVVFVTNDPSLPRRCDRVVLMGKDVNGGGGGGGSGCSRIVDVGNYDDLISRGYDLKSIGAIEDDKDDSDDDLQLIESEEVTPAIEVTAARHIQVVNTDEVDSIHNGAMNMTAGQPHADPDCHDCTKYDENSIPDRVIPTSPDTIVEDNISFSVHSVEEKKSKTSLNTPVKSASQESSIPKLSSADDFMSKGAIPRHVYVSYFKAINNPSLIILMILSYIMVNSAQFYQQFIVAKWTEIGRANAMASAMQARYLASLVQAAAVVSVFLFLRSFFTMLGGVRASSTLHSKMLKSVFSAPLSFFDATPSGQLLSRFGKEMDTVDRALPDGISSVLYCFLQIFFSGAALSGVITPGLAIPLVATSFFYIRVMRNFRPAARDMKRAESKSRSPIYTHFGEALRGAETIRSVPSGSETWSAQHKRYTDENLSVFYTVKSFDRRLSVQLETLGNGVVLLCAIVSIFLSKLGRLKPGNAGWGLTQALSITGLLTWAVRCLTDLESQMMSVSRLKEITDIESTSVDLSKMPREKSGTGEALPRLSTGKSLKLPPTPDNDVALIEAGWPWRGDVKFKNVSMRYNPVSPLVLKNVSVHVPAGSTLGVVGRTGSGKSSLLLTLFRLVEIEEERGGSVEIDGVDIRSIGLQTLRQKLSIIPQDPVLFAGTVMYNLDATNTSSEEDAWEALNAASPELVQQFKNEGTGLQTRITEGGKNLSLGQRQLICLARALLRKSKILVLDEATSSVDTQTDAQVQATIRKEFVEKGVTVITVAHRLETVLGYDKICVLGDGSVLEYGSPADLIKKEDGELRRLVNADLQNKRKGAGTTERTANGVHAM